MKIILNFFFQKKFIKFKIYRNFINKVYQLIKYDRDYFFKPEKKILNLHLNNLYKHKVEKRDKMEVITSDRLVDFDSTIDNNFKDFFNVDISKMVSVIGSRFNSDEDPLCKTAMQIIMNNKIDFKSCFLNTYFQNFKPKNYSEVFQIKDCVELNKINRYSYFYPWFHEYPPRVLHNGLFGPKTFETVEFRCTRIKNICDLIKKYNYIPDQIDCIEGYVLSYEKDYRFVVTSGTHRSSVLSAMNKIGNFPQKVPVRFDNMRVEDKIFLIKLSDVNIWPAVSSGYLKKEEAITFFKSFFKDKKYL